MKVVASHAEDARSSPAKAEPIYMYCAQVALRGYCSVKGVGSTVTVNSQFDLPSLMPLSVAGCGRQRLGAPHWATWVTLLQVVDN